MVNEYEEWFNSWRKESWSNEAETSVLESYLRSSITSSEAAENISKPGPNRRLPASTKIGSVWEILFACPAIVNLIREITLLPNRVDGNQVDWNDQSATFREMWGATYNSKAKLLWEFMPVIKLTFSRSSSRAGFQIHRSARVPIRFKHPKMDQLPCLQRFLRGFQHLHTRGSRKRNVCHP
jgi:hypothetical protein